MQRVLDPAQIEAFAQRAVPRIRLPDPARVFARRAARLRQLSEGNAVGDYLRLMASLADAQQNALNKLIAVPVARLDDRFRVAQEHGMPPLQASGWIRDVRWRTVLQELCSAIATAPGYPEGVSKVCRDILALLTPAPTAAVQAAPLETQADLLLGVATTSDNPTQPEPRIEASSAPFLMAALQVYWTALLSSLSHNQISEHLGGMDVPGVCPVCGTLPVASLVSAEKNHQGYRYLHCALCATEWHLVRIKCSQCESTAGIHYHSIEGGSTAIRAEACDHCRTYRKICYQEHDREVEPLADDLASLGLDLLMSEAGFQRASGHPLLWQ